MIDHVNLLPTLAFVAVSYIIIAFQFRVGVNRKSALLITLGAVAVIFAVKFVSNFFVTAQEFLSLN